MPLYMFLFGLATLAMAGWALMILLPHWRWTRRLVAWAVFPVYLAAIYALGLLALLNEMGPGIIGEFGTADGVIGILAQPEVALIAWIHILAFDHLAGVMIYRDNMRHRLVPIPMQSALLILTLLFGPLGFLSYYTIRLARRRRLEGSTDQVADVETPPARSSDT